MDGFEDKIEEDEELSGEMKYEDDPQEDVEALQRELREAEAIFVSESNSPKTRISATTEGNGMIQSVIQPRLPQSILAQRDTSGGSRQPRMSSSVKTVVISDDIEEADLTFITAEDNSTLAGNTDSIITDEATVVGESETNPRPRRSSTISNNRSAANSRRAGRSSKRPRRSRSTTTTSSSNARNSASAEDSGRRRSHLCCGFFCDLRRACLIVDIGYICLTALGLIILFRESSYFNLYNSSLSDVGNNDNNKPAISYTVSMIKTMCGMCFGLVGIIGATTFHAWLVFATFVWMAIDVISSLFFKDWLTVVFVGLFVYPQFALFLAIQSGNLGRDNYSTEKHCFLCPGR